MHVKHLLGCQLLVHLNLQQACDVLQLIRPNTGGDNQLSPSTNHVQCTRTGLARTNVQISFSGWILTGFIGWACCCTAQQLNTVLDLRLSVNSTYRLFPARSDTDFASEERKMYVLPQAFQP